MLAEWEKSLLSDVLANPERYNPNRGCNDWNFPSWMTRDNELDMILKMAYMNDDGEEIAENYDGDEDLYVKENSHVMNFEVPLYLYCRLESEGIIPVNPQEYDG